MSFLRFRRKFVLGTVAPRVTQMDVVPRAITLSGTVGGGGDPLLYQGLTPTTTVSTVAQLNSALASATPGTIIGVLPGVYQHSTGGSPYHNFTPAFNPASSGTVNNPIIIVGQRNPTAMASPLTDATRTELRAGSGSYSGSDSHPVFGSNARNYIQWRNIVCDETQCRTTGDNGPCYIANCTGVLIDSCVIKGSTDSVFLADNHSAIRIGEGPSTELDHSVTNCKLFGFTIGFGLNAAAIITYGGRNLTIENNEIWDSGIGIYIKGSGGGETHYNYGSVSYNLIYDTISGLKLQDIAAANNLIVEHNVSNGVLYTVASNNANTRNIKFRRNSLVQDADADTGSGVMFVSQFTGGGCEFNDNIVFNRVGNTMYMDGGGYTQNNFTNYDFNGFFGSTAGTKWSWNGANQSTIAQLHAAVANSNGNQLLASNPFVNSTTGDYTVTGAALTASSTGGPIGASWALVGPGNRT